MNAKNAKTLRAVFVIPIPAGIVFADLEALISALGGLVREGAGSRVVFELQGRRIYLHRPHPGKEAKRYQVEEIRLFLETAGITP
jgi:hypothetical protein